MYLRRNYIRIINKLTCRSSVTSVFLFLECYFPFFRFVSFLFFEWEGRAIMQPRSICSHYTSLFIAALRKIANICQGTVPGFSHCRVWERNSKGGVFPVHDMKAYMESSPTYSLTLDLDGGEWLASFPAHFTPRKEVRYPELVWTNWRREKLWPLLGFEPQTVQSEDYSL